MDKKQQMIEKQLAQAYLKGRVDAQRELVALIKCMEAEIERLKPSNKRRWRNKMEHWKKANTDCFWYSYNQDGNAWISECDFIDECYVCPCLVHDYEDDYECENFITDKDARQLIRDFFETQ